MKHSRRAPISAAIFTALALVVGAVFVAPALASSIKAAADGPVVCSTVDAYGKFECQLPGYPTPSATTTATATPVPTATSSPTTSPTATSTPAPSPTQTPTTSPTQSPTPTPTQTAPTGWPDASTTGVPPGTALKVTSGRTISLPNAVIDGEEIRGCVTVTAANVTIKNSRILGNGCFYAVQNKALNLTLSDVEITCGGSAGTGVTASNYTLYRADISGCENGLNVGGNVALIDSWIHDLVLPAGAHTDGVQMNEGAGNVLIRHNRFEVQRWATSSIIMWDEGGAQNFNVLVEDNLLSGGGYVVYCPRQAASNVRVVNNRIGNWGYGPQNGCWSPNATFTGNTRLDGSRL